tara:strand:- start:1105 stop:1464 length:360 start_codon:yes stop_codon:yes gene_type:complete
MKMSESDNYPDLLKLANEADAPISPDRQDTEALKYLRRIQLNIEELNEMDDMDEKMDMISELAEDSVPIATYDQFNAYSQLGLYGYNPDEIKLENIQDIVTYALYMFAEDALVQIGLNQ